MNSLIKTSIKKTVALIFTIVMIVSCFSYVAFAAVTPPSPSTSDIIVSNITPKDKFNAFKLMDIEYDNATNTLLYKWTAAVKTILDAQGIKTTPDDFAAMNDKDTRQDFIAGITKYLIQGGTIGEVQIPVSEPANATPVEADSNGEVKFTDMTWGEYLIVPTLTTSVYEIMIGVIQPTATNGSWNTVGQTDKLQAKKSDGPTLTKTPSETNVGSWTTIKYTIEFDVPTYDSSIVDKTLTLSDSADSTVAFLGNTEIYGQSGKELTQLDFKNILNTYTIPEIGDKGFKLNFDFKYDTINTYDKIIIYYNAKVTETSPLNFDLTNTASLTYSNYPYITGSHITITDTATVKTYGLEIFKYDKAYGINKSFEDIVKNAKPLKDAIFDVYRLAESNENTDKVIDGKKVIKIASITTQENGYASLNTIKYGTYYLQETQAPTGYNSIKDPIKVTFNESDLNDLGYYTTLVGNSNGFELPQTGGMGTTIFTVSGIALMAGAVVLLVILNKNKIAKKNK